MAKRRKEKDRKKEDRLPPEIYIEEPTKRSKKIIKTGELGSTVLKEEVRKMREELEREGLRTKDVVLVARLWKNMERMKKPGMKETVDARMKLLLSYVKDKKMSDELYKKELVLDHTWYEDIIMTLIDPGSSQAEIKEERAMGKLVVGIKLNAEENESLKKDTMEKIFREYRGSRRDIPELAKCADLLFGGATHKRKKKKLQAKKIAQLKKQRDAMLERKFAKRKAPTIKRKRSRKR